MAHRNARLTPLTRLELVRELDAGWPQAEVARHFRVSRHTVAKWLGRFRAEGAAGLEDRTPQDEVRDALEECVTSAARAAFRGEPEAEIIKKLLDHPDLRFRFSYTLGRDHLAPPAQEDDDFEDEYEDDLVLEDDVVEDEVSQPWQEQTGAGIRDALAVIGRVVAEQRAEAVALAEPDQPGDRVAAEDLIDEQLDGAIRRQDAVQELVDDLLELVKLRFEPVASSGTLAKTRQGWPMRWMSEESDRPALLEQLRRFTSNDARRFGELLSPLVNGVRVSGPFIPAWAGDSPPPMVLIDGEGLGHTPNSSQVISTMLRRRIREADVVVLVDNAAQPIQAAAIAALRAITTGGQTDKLRVAFTHMDTVRGDNLPDADSRRYHVLASADGALVRIGDDVGTSAEHALRDQIQEQSFFLGGIQNLIDSRTRLRATRQQLRDLLASITSVPVEVEDTSISRPEYRRSDLTLGVVSAVLKFHERWDAILGRRRIQGAQKEHWTRIKALSRRIAEGWRDEYDSLKPVADLQEELQKQLYELIQSPASWTGDEPGESETRQILDGFLREVERRVAALCTRRITEEHRQAWQRAYAEVGTGSSFRRADIIAEDVYRPAAPVPDTTTMSDRKALLREVEAIVEESAEVTDVRFR